MNISLKSHEVLLTFPHRENASVTSGAGPFADQNHRFSYPFTFWSTSGIPTLLYTWLKPEKGTPPRFGHYRECPPDLQLAYTLHTCTLENRMLINSFRAFHTRVYVSCFRTKRITRRPLFDPVRFKKRRNLNSRTCNYLSHFLRLINVFRSFFDEKYQFLPLWLQVHVASLKIFA